MNNICTKFKALIGLSLLTVVLGGCDTPTGKDSESAYKTYYNPSAALWVDPETKCEYISGSIGSAMTPRLGRSGKQICR